jgi:hypothetical protein
LQIDGEHKSRNGVMAATRMIKRASALAIGVTGHRPNRMPAAARGRVERQLSQVMAEIEASNPGRRPTLFSGLAEGADRLAAFVALGRGWSLGTVLPFYRSRFEEDFPEPHAIGEFRALLAASSQVEEPDKRAHIGKAPEAGYIRVGQRLLALSDLLIAVWDGEASQGRGGTVELARQAQQREIPVIWVHAKKAQEPQWLSPANWSSKRPKAKRIGACPAMRRY